MVLAAVVVVAGSTVALAAETAAFDGGQLERDRDLLAAWITGQFDTGASPARLRLTVEAVVDPEADGPTLRARWEGPPDLAGDGAEGWQLVVDAAADAVVMFRSRPANDGQPPEVMEGCEVVWRRAGNGFDGLPGPAPCAGAGAPGAVWRLDADGFALAPRGGGAEEAETALAPVVRLQRGREYQARLRISGGDERRVSVLDVDGEASIAGPKGARYRVQLSRVPRREVVRAQVDRLGANRAPEAILAIEADAATEHFGGRVVGLELELVRTDDSGDDLDRLVSWMAGSFSSAAQAATDESFFDVRLHMAPIWTGRADGRWLYVEQAVADSQDRPYRQRVYRVRRVAPDLYESAVYFLPDPDAAIGAWRMNDPLADVAPTDLEPRTGCEILLRRRGDAYVGSTLGRLCPSDLRGAAFATSDVRLDAAELVSWDRGFNAAGAQVWGARTGGYVFERIDPAAEVDETAEAVGDDAAATGEPGS
jgi:hypothetical protein